MQKELSDKLDDIEVFLKLFLIVFLISLILVQVLLTKEPYRSYLNLSERLEGITWSDTTDSNFMQSVHTGKIMITSGCYFLLPDVKVLVNNRQVNKFICNSVVVSVKDGDEISIDASAYDCPLKFKVVDVSPEISWPPVNYQIITSGSVVRLGKIKFR